MEPETCGFHCVDFIDEVVNAESTGDLGAMIVEPYQGAAGFIFPPEGYLTRLQEWCRAHEVLFILDEVQSSFGRTGKMFALEWEGLRPNLLCVGKGIGSGVPTAALLAESRLFASLGPGEMSSTTGGNPLSCAAGLAVLGIMEEEKLADNALRVGQMMLGRLQRMAEDVFVAEELVDYVLALVQFTRSHARVYLGGSPRSALALMHASKAQALLRARDYVLPDDVRSLAPLVLAHRVLMTPDAELEGHTGTAIVAEALDKVGYKTPRR
jgi:acetylornithine/succinyldiaminopimelate/putrescine aminotransferase